MKIGNLVKRLPGDESDEDSIGIVTRIDINMWGEETIPSGVEVLWGGSEIEVYPEDELVNLDNPAKADRETFKEKENG
jgi:hypothetical protein